MTKILFRRPEHKIKKYKATSKEMMQYKENLTPFLNYFSTRAFTLSLFFPFLYLPLNENRFFPHTINISQL